MFTIIAELFDVVFELYLPFATSYFSVWFRALSGSRSESSTQAHSLTFIVVTRGYHGSCTFAFGLATTFRFGCRLRLRLGDCLGLSLTIIRLTLRA